MERINTILFISDEEYTKALITCMQSARLPIDFTVCEEATKLDEIFKDKYKNFDLLITDTKKVLDFIEEDVIHIMYISEDREKCKTENILYKYSNMTEAADKIFEVCGKKRGVPFETVQAEANAKCMIYAVTASKGGIGASSVAVGIAKDFALAGSKNVLYLSIGAWHCERRYFMPSSEMPQGNLREYLYEIKYAKKPFYENKTSYFSRDLYGIYSFNTTTFENILMDLSIDDFEIFLMKLRATGLFDVIIFDIGACASEYADCAKNISDFIICLTESAPDVFEEVLLRREQKKFAQKLVVAENFKIISAPKFEEFFSESEEPEEVKSEKEKRVFIARDDDAFSMINGVREIDISGKFGRSIRELVEKCSNAFCL